MCAIYLAIDATYMSTYVWHLVAAGREYFSAGAALASTIDLLRLQRRGYIKYEIMRWSAGLWQKVQDIRLLPRSAR
jgi:hypothetical protein